MSGGSLSNAGLATLARGCTALRELYLAGCRRVGDAGVEEIARGCPRLRLLDVQGCAMVGDAGALALASHCAAQLDTVSFQCCPRLTDEGFGALCAACPRLRHVTLKHCRVSEAAIASALRASGQQLYVRVVETGKRM